MEVPLAYAVSLCTNILSNKNKPLHLLTELKDSKNGALSQKKICEYFFILSCHICIFKQDMSRPLQLQFVSDFHKLLLFKL